MTTDGRLTEHRANDGSTTHHAKGYVPPPEEQVWPRSNPFKHHSRDDESLGPYGGRARVLKSFDLDVETGSRPSNVWYGSAQVHEPTHTKMRAEPGDLVEFLPGGDFLTKRERRVTVGGGKPVTDRVENVRYKFRTSAGSTMRRPFASGPTNRHLKDLDDDTFAFDRRYKGYGPRKETGERRGKRATEAFEAPSYSARLREDVAVAIDERLTEHRERDGSTKHHAKGYEADHYADLHDRREPSGSFDRRAFGPQGKAFERRDPNRAFEPTKIKQVRRNMTQGGRLNVQDEIDEISTDKTTGVPIVKNAVTGSWAFRRGGNLENDRRRGERRGRGRG